MPKRIQLSRAKGWRKPEGAVVVARNTKWGNPFKIGEPGADGSAMTRQDVCECFEHVVLPGLDISDLRGKDLACWCPLDKPCHADVLLKYANK